MLKIDRQKKTFACLDTPSLADASILERSDLQEYIWNSPDAFFKEIGQTLFLIAKEIRPSDDVDDRIDILALDKDGQAVIIELKRGSHKLQMFQAISYAGMVASWQPNDFVRCLDVDKRESLRDFLDVESEEFDVINRRQRIILVAEAFDYSVLVGAEWLTEKFGVDILCCRLSLAKDSVGNTEFLVCSNVFPAPELAKVAVGRGGSGKGIRPPKWRNWDAALENVSNAAVVAFYKKELEARRECLLRPRQLTYRINGKRRWKVFARHEKAYVWQRGRFDDDIKFWCKELSQADQVKPVMDDRCLSFLLTTDSDFEFFRHSTEKLVNSIWTGLGDEHGADLRGDDLS